MSDDYKTIRVPTWVYENALTARADVVRRGLDAVPEGWRSPATCPHCGSEHVDHLVVDLFHCGSCGYKQASVDATGDTAIKVGLGVVIGLGLAGLFAAMAAPTKPQRKPQKRTTTTRKRKAT